VGLLVLVSVLLVVAEGLALVLVPLVVHLQLGVLQVLPAAMEGPQVHHLWMAVAARRRGVLEDCC